ncbi:MAG: efflux RND transporter periplasmic adaptor subunit [Desulfobacterales bacterium]|jgi:HlyD family secretion protein/macrolide-specific efflux system membrane fusion protein
MMKKAIAVIVFLVVAVGVGLWWTSSTTEKKITVLATETVTRGTVRKVLEQTGIVKSQVGAIVKIGTRATGTIDKMMVKVGDPVKKDQLVAQIDSRELEAQATEARAKLAAAQAELNRVEQVYPLRIKEARHDLALTRARADYLHNNYLRQQKLAERNVISEDTIEDVYQKAEVETNQVSVKQSTLVRLQREFTDEAAKARAAVKQAEASLAALDVRKSYTRVYSPISGVVSQVTAQEGETIVAGLQVANLITVLDPVRLEMWTYVDETDIGQVHPGQPVEFRVDAYPGRVFKGAVDTIYPEPEIRDNIVYYRALVKINPEQATFLRPEMTTQVQIIVAVKDNVLDIPNNALKWVDGRQVVFVQDSDGKIRQVTPELGLAGVTHTEVLEGLAAGDKVATQVVLPGNKEKKGKP